MIGLPTMGWALPHQSLIKKNILQLHLMEVSSPVRSCVRVHACTLIPMEPEWAMKAFGAGVISVCELPHVGTVNQTLVLC